LFSFENDVFTFFFSLPCPFLEAAGVNNKEPAGLFLAGIVLLDARPLPGVIASSLTPVSGGECGGSLVVAAGLQPARVLYFLGLLGRFPTEQPHKKPG
jgi:hypothetical protein